MIQVTNFTYSYGKQHHGWITNKANSAGGVSVSFDVKNCSTKPIKSFAVFFTAYNGASEPVKCTVTRTVTKGVSDHDFLGGRATREGLLFKNAWYNHSIRSVRIDHIDVVYQYGTKKSCITRIR